MSLNPTPISFIVEGAPRALLVHLTDASAPDETADRLRGLCGDFAWAALGVSDWNGDLSPWPAQAAFAGAAFAGRGPDTLDALLGALPDLQARLPRPLPVCLGGYSLAGLFALWAAHASDAFAAAVAASPSVWLPGWDAWADARRPARIPFYLSLGLKEPKARNPMLAAVGDAIGREHARLEAAGCPCVLEWNPGGPFRGSRRPHRAGLCLGAQPYGRGGPRVTMIQERGRFGRWGHRPKRGNREQGKTGRD